ncbi:hypothetical protein NDU88_011214 [Pleurodeles waltl]|uniref:Uncharacterized protein n=1 Tax=Pleurodeles waltl TaxID=8319 RepID=A0AAV7Q427_PLEWA|nr:hypothetical protein NDU88_011214 [Pleurodeles waltl]
MESRRAGTAQADGIKVDRHCTGMHGRMESRRAGTAQADGIKVDRHCTGMHGRMESRRAGTAQADLIKVDRHCTGMHGRMASRRAGTAQSTGGIEFHRRKQMIGAKATGAPGKSGCACEAGPSVALPNRSWPGDGAARTLHTTGGAAEGRRALEGEGSEKARRDFYRNEEQDCVLHVREGEEYRGRRVRERLEKKVRAPSEGEVVGRGALAQGRVGSGETSSEEETQMRRTREGRQDCGGDGAPRGGEGV